jgi:CPA1 family monovalent cation:H+ antiporter
LALTVLRFESLGYVEISPEVILGILVPPLIFEAAYHLHWHELRRNLGTIMALAIPGVVMTTLLVGLVVSFGTGIAFSLALVFGALVAATDPVAVVALFRTIGVPSRLQVLLEGESLFNDGTAIVVFNLVLVIVTSGSFVLTESLVNFVRVVGGGLMVGLMTGVAISWMISRIDEPLIETALTTVLAFGAYLIAEDLHVSGVLAVVSAGLVSGNLGPERMSPTTRIVVNNFWEYAAFLANSFAFLVIGLSIEMSTLIDNWPVIIIAILTVLGARGLVVLGFTVADKTLPRKWRAVLLWGGLRGAISLALALSLPLGLEGREELQAMAFGVVLFTLLVQGTTMEALLRRLGMIGKGSEGQLEYERRHARAVAARAAFERLQRLNQHGLISDHTWETIAPVMQHYTASLIEAVRDVMSDAPDVLAEELETAWREKLRAQRDTLNSLRLDGVISNETYAQLVGEVDAAIADGTSGWGSLVRGSLPGRMTVQHLIAAIIQEKDYENTISALTKLSLPTTRLPSRGGFLGSKNVTLLIGVATDQVELAVRAIRASSRSRVEFVTDSGAIDLPVPAGSGTEVKVGGATLFMFDVEHYEEF